MLKNKYIVTALLVLLFGTWLFVDFPLIKHGYFESIDSNEYLRLKKEAVLNAPNLNECKNKNIRNHFPKSELDDIQCLDFENNKILILSEKVSHSVSFYIFDTQTNIFKTVRGKKPSSISSITKLNGNTVLITTDYYSYTNIQDEFKGVLLLPCGILEYLYNLAHCFMCDIAFLDHPNSRAMIVDIKKEKLYRTSDLTSYRTNNTSMLLKDGRVLLIGGEPPPTQLNAYQLIRDLPQAEIYVPNTIK